ncbi:MAG TPA: hypothetical protein PKN48_08410 [Bacteroidales bacterium]|nr:hypothetical protein [Bacteroidales bacterium]
MKKNKFAWSFALPFIGAIPVILVGAFEQKIRAGWGDTAWTVMFVIAMVIVFALALLPFISIFKGMFGGKGINFFWGTGKLARQILASGSDATATIVSIGENSQGGIVTINDQPLLNLVLRIDNNYDPEYDVSFDTIIPRSAVPQFQPGAKFAVKVDRADKNNVVFNQKSADSSNIPDKKPTYGGKGWTELDRLRMEQAGIDGMAKLMSIEETGKSEDFNPVILMGYEVTIPGETPYFFEKEIAMPTEAAMKLKTLIGSSYKARIHPDDKTKIAVDFTF